MIHVLGGHEVRQQLTGESTHLEVRERAVAVKGYVLGFEVDHRMLLLLRSARVWSSVRSAEADLGRELVEAQRVDLVALDVGCSRVQLGVVDEEDTAASAWSISPISAYCAWRASVSSFVMASSTMESTSGLQ